MTGFGSVVVTRSSPGVERRYTVTVKTVNHRHLDLKFRLGKELVHLEPQIAKRLRKHMSRGHIDIIVETQRSGSDSNRLVLDHQLASDLFQDATSLASELGVAPPSLGDILRMPGVVTQHTVSGAEDDPSHDILQGVVQATMAALSMRQTEGVSLQSDIQNRIQRLSECVETIEGAVPALVSEQFARLQVRVSQIVRDTGSVDSHRLETELALLADKCDVSEEVFRVRSHLTQFEDELLREPYGSGKKLAFLTQELHREFNTIGSKVGDPAIITVVIEAKTELEKVREQVANIE
ncbi:MAG: YicC/YloC family endoribonuclease [Myxococcota bacterium]|nr:YicC/YloC family endoribonuclease [Myxococcota bacterium]